MYAEIALLRSFCADYVDTLLQDTLERSQSSYKETFHQRPQATPQHMVAAYDRPDKADLVASKKSRYAKQSEEP